ncbi:MAG: hypothetical protein GTO24_21270 [candidate division Zixibacteria bacterium]|nr:hypothetical protein [candidate division Zixibacteria bacterium]
MDNAVEEEVLEEETDFEDEGYGYAYEEIAGPFEVEPPDPPEPTDVVTEENPGCDLTAILVICGIIAAFAVFIGFLVLPNLSGIQDWANEKILGNEKSPVVEQIMEECPETTIVEPSHDACLTFISEAVDEIERSDCPVCPQKYVLPDHAAPESLPAYLDKAEEIIDEMIAIKTTMEILQSFFDEPDFESEYQMNLTFEDDQWLLLYEDMQVRVSKIGVMLWMTWPPPPHDSGNPLLDAHARIITAYLLLDAASDTFRDGYSERTASAILVGWEGFIDGMMQNIDYARNGLDLAR